LIKYEEISYGDEMIVQEAAIVRKIGGGYADRKNWAGLEYMI
jgi:hypothetical protein